MHADTSHSTPEQDHDSFLDIVANIVGILIILVMVVSIRAREAPEVSPDPPKEQSDLQSQQVKHAALQQDVARLVAASSTLDDYLVVRDEERQRLCLILAATEDEIDQQRSQLTKSDNTKARRPSYRTH